MSRDAYVELFCLKAGLLCTELRLEVGHEHRNGLRTDLEVYTDSLVDRFLKQVDPTVRDDAARMGEFYRMFYTVENDIRQFIDQTFSDFHGEGWWNAFVPQIVRDNVKKVRERKEIEGIPPRSSKSLDYTTFGELADIIQANWDVFSGIFINASKNRVLRVLRRLNMARGPIAHSGIIPEAESVRLRLYIRDWYGLLE